MVRKKTVRNTLLRYLIRYTTGTTKYNVTENPDTLYSKYKAKIFYFVCLYCMRDKELDKILGLLSFSVVKYFILFAKHFWLW